MESTINIIGLVLDIVGAIGLFFFGVPGKDFSDNTVIMNNYPIEKEKMYRSLSKVSLMLIILGFIMQLISNVI